ncbi:MAG: hypothetical protein KDI63_06490 [Gammaproteobacteria bacterium]|nr:hypothetical protein [Gammaproteobacteria bacterium]
MRRSTLIKQRLLAVFFMGILLLFSPVTTLFDGPGQVFGIPVLYLYLFGAWGGLIIAMAWIVGSGNE